MLSGQRFAQSLSLVGPAFNGDDTLRYDFTGDLPPNAGAAYSFETNTIYMPPIDMTQVDRHNYLKLLGFDAHERKHHLLTSSEIMKKEAKKLNQLQMTMFQRLEDARIEKNKHYRYTGEDYAIEYFRNWEVMQEYTHEEHLNHAKKNPYGYVMAALQYNFCNFGSFPIPSEIQKLYDIGWKILNDGRFTKSLSMKREGSIVSLNVAVDIYNAWQKEKEQKQEKQQKEEKSESKGQDESGQKDNGQKSSQPASPNDQFQEDQKEQDFSPDKLNKEIEELAKSQGWKPEDSEGLSEKMKEKSSPFRNRKYDKPVPDFIPYVPYTAKDEEIVPPENRMKFEMISAESNVALQRIRNEIVSRMVAESKTTIHRNQRRGKLDRRKLAKATMGAQNIYYKKKKGISRSISVQLVVDLSGSMIGREVELATRVAIGLSEMFNDVGMELEVVGFRTKAAKDPVITDDQAISLGFNRGGYEAMAYYHFKKFDEPYHSAKFRLGSMVGSAGGANIDHESIYKAAASLFQRKTDRKIQLVISDGQPAATVFGKGNFNWETILDRELVKTNKMIRSVGIEQVGFAINSTEVKRYYEDYIVITKLEDLVTTMFSKLANLILPQ